MRTAQRMGPCDEGLPHSNFPAKVEPVFVVQATGYDMSNRRGFVLTLLIVNAGNYGQIHK